MHDIPELVAGYRRFLNARSPDDAAAYRTLAEAGQSPHTMIVACCDSRVDPATIFSARPGELFVVRNVANLVPPFEPHGDYHGTSAALEFAVDVLGVRTVLVMGHARCGGVRAFMDGLQDWSAQGGFIDRWMSLLNPSRQVVLKTAAGLSDQQQQQALEYQGVRQSLEHLHSFPFVAERLAAGELKLRGAYFDIATGRLLYLDAESGTFAPLQVAGTAAD